ncbi:MAG: MBL fold metallo-hydrolase [Acidobacteria bacterium]|nr:MBL fold metallo-hydrolase [Acidobacteriota bacterium]
MKKLLTIFLAASVLAVNGFAHGDNSHFNSQQEVTVKTTKVVGNIFMLQGRGGNIGAMVAPEGILMIDDDYKVVSEKLRDALKELGSEKPRFIFNTHWHGDHTEGNQFFGKESIIVAHRNVRVRLSQINTVFGQKTVPYPESALPMITYTESMSIHFGGEEVKAVYYPNGHTDGDTVVFFTKSNVVHLGDNFFVGRFPFVDLDNGGNVQGLINNIGSLIKTIPADAKLIPGHGPLATLDDLKAFHQMLIESSKVVADAMKKKKTLEEIKKAGLPDKFKEAGSGFIKTDRWIEIVFNSYSKK